MAMRGLPLIATLMAPRPWPSQRVGPADRWSRLPSAYRLHPSMTGRETRGIAGISGALNLREQASTSSALVAQ